MFPQMKVQFGFSFFDQLNSKDENIMDKLKKRK